jgi:hypothetical protein
MLLESLEGFGLELEKWKELLIKKDRAQLKEYFEQCKKSKQPFKREKGIYPKDGVPMFISCAQEEIPEIARIALENGALSVSKGKDGVSIACPCREDADKLKIIFSMEEKWKNIVIFVHYLHT